MRELWGSPTRWNVRRTYLDVAAKLGVDEETVRNRLRRLKESGYLKGWRVMPNPAVFGRESRMTFVQLGDSRTKEAALSRLERTDGVVVVASVYGKGAIVTFFDDRGRAASELIASLGEPGSARSIGGMPFMRTSFRMTATDWQIVRAMLRDAERDISDVAVGVKTSARTVRRRLNLMLDSAAILIMPMINQSRSGGVSYTAMIECERGRVAEVERAASAKIENLGFAAHYSDSGLVFGFIARNVSEGNQFERWAEGQPGVRSVTMNLVEEVVYAFDWLERESEKRARSTGREGLEA